MVLRSTLPRLACLLLGLAPAAWSQPIVPPPPPPQEEMVPVDPDSPVTSMLINEEDPRMQEIVGMMLIPDLGTNEILEMLENFTGKPILRQAGLPQVRITFSSRGPLTRAEAIMALESLLALNGIAITEVGDTFLKAVPLGLINTQVPPVWEGTTLDAAPSQKIYEKLFVLDYLLVQDALPLIQPLLSQGAPIAFNRNNMLLIADALINLQRLERLFQIIDRPSPLKRAILYFELRNVSARDLSDRLRNMVDNALAPQLQSNTFIEVDERTNQLIVFTHPSNEALIRGIVDRLDTDAAPLTSTRVFNIRYAEAPDVVDILDQVITGQREAEEEAGGGDNNQAAVRAAQRRAQQVAQQNAAAAAARAEGSNLQFSSYITLVPDERANTIVASGTENDLRALAQLIDQIDVLLAQVRIEVIIASVTLRDGYATGLEQIGILGNVDAEFTSGTNGPGYTYPRLGDNTVVTPSFANPGLDLNVPLVFGPGDKVIDFVLGQARSRSDLRVLSAPTIVTTHNREANISVTDSIPVVTGTTTTLDSVTDPDDLGLARTNVQYRDVGIELSVTPLIGSDGVVQLEIDQSIDSEQEDTRQFGNPVIQQRSASSYVSVANGQLVVLAGLQQVTRNKSQGELFFFGKLPIIGQLLNPRSESEDRTELLIFIRPVIVTDTIAANFDAERQIESNTAQEEIERYLEQGNFDRPPEPEPKVERVRRGPRL